MRSSSQNHQPAAYNIELVDKLVRVLETLRDAPEGLSLQAIAVRTGYVKSSIHRTLGSLKVMATSSSRRAAARIVSASSACCSPAG